MRTWGPGRIRIKARDVNTFSCQKISKLLGIAKSKLPGIYHQSRCSSTFFRDKDLSVLAVDPHYKHCVRCRPPVIYHSACWVIGRLSLLVWRLSVAGAIMSWPLQFTYEWLLACGSRECCCMVAVYNCTGCMQDVVRTAQQNKKPKIITNHNLRFISRHTFFALFKQVFLLFVGSWWFRPRA